jgi:Ca2+-binding RTX toxin-like protein
VIRNDHTVNSPTVNNVADFHEGASHDRIDVSQVMRDDGGNDVPVDWNYIAANAVSSGDGTMIHLGHGGLLHLDDAEPSELRPEDFIFADQAAVSVRTDAGYSMATFYTALNSVDIVATFGTEGFFAAATDMQNSPFSFFVRGNDFNFAPGNPDGIDLVSGTVTSFDIVDPVTRAPIASMWNVDIDASQLNAAIDQYESSNGNNTTLLDGIFANQKYSTIGAAGNDTLLSGHQDDYLRGGGGADTFVFSPMNGADLITDFSSIQGDKIVLDHIYQYGSSDPLFQQLLDDLEASDPSDYTIELPQGFITLNVSVNTLTQSDFIVLSPPINPYA